MSEGVRSLSAFWIGGASSVDPVAAGGGVRSLLAFWMGGAADGGGTPVTTGKKPGAFRKLRFHHFIQSDDDEPEKLPKPTKKRVRAVQNAVLAEAAGLLGHAVPPSDQKQVREDVKQAYTPRVDPAELEALLDEILRLTIQRINDEIEAEDEEILLMAI